MYSAISGRVSRLSRLGLNRIPFLINKVSSVFGNPSGLLCSVTIQPLWRISLIMPSASTNKGFFFVPMFPFTLQVSPVLSPVLSEKFIWHSLPGYSSCMRLPHTMILCSPTSTKVNAFYPFSLLCICIYSVCFHCNSIGMYRKLPQISVVFVHYTRFGEYIFVNCASFTDHVSMV